MGAGGIGGLIEFYFGRPQMLRNTVRVRSAFFFLTTEFSIHRFKLPVGKRGKPSSAFPRFRETGRKFAFEGPARPWHLAPKTRRNRPHHTKIKLKYGRCQRFTGSKLNDKGRVPLTRKRALFWQGDHPGFVVSRTCKCRPTGVVITIHESENCEQKSVGECSSAGGPRVPNGAVKTVTSPNTHRAY